MKKEDLLTAFEALNPRRNSPAYEILKDLFTGKNKTYRVTKKPYTADLPFIYHIRPCVLEGIGRSARNVDHADEVRGYLDMLGVSYVITNDAPRNAKTGQLITILTQLI